MARRLTLAAIVAAALFVAFGPAARGEGEKSPLDRFTPEQKEKLLAGEAIFEVVENKTGEGETRGHGQSSAIVDRDIDACFKIFTEYGKQQLYFPRKTKSEVLKTDGDKSWVQKEFDFTLTTIKYVVIYDADKEKHRVDFQMDPSYPHDLEDTTGYFDFDKIDDKRTLVTYAATKVETGLKVPGFIQEYITSKDLPDVVVNIKKRIESDGKWEKDE